MSRLVSFSLPLLVLLLASLATAHNADPHSGSFLVRLASPSHEVSQLLFSLIDKDDLRIQPDGAFEVFLSDSQYATILSRLDSTSSMEILERSGPLRSKLNLPEGYLDLAGIWDRLTTLVRANPGILTFVNLTSYGPGTTYQGREMPMVKLSDNVNVDEDEPNILIVASHHAREIVNPHIVLDLLDRLVSGYNRNDTTLKGIVESYEIFLSPLWNPDGYNHVWEVDNMWRKNRKPQ